MLKSIYIDFEFWKSCEVTMCSIIPAFISHLFSPFLKHFTSRILKFLWNIWILSLKRIIFHAFISRFFSLGLCIQPQCSNPYAGIWKASNSFVRMQMAALSLGSWNLPLKPERVWHPNPRCQLSSPTAKRIKKLARYDFRIRGQGRRNREAQ